MAKSDRTKIATLSANAKEIVTLKPLYRTKNSRFRKQRKIRLEIDSDNRLDRYPSVVVPVVCCVDTCGKNSCDAASNLSIVIIKY